LCGNILEGLQTASALVAASLVGGVLRWHAAHTFDPFGFNV